MVGWHHWLNGHEFEQAPGNSEGQGSLVWCAAVHGVTKSWTRLSNWTTTAEGHQEYIYKWNNSHRAAAAHYQRPQTPKKIRKDPHVTRWDERDKRKKRSRKGPLPLWKSVAKGEETFLYPKNIFTGGEISRDRKRAFRAQRRVGKPACVGPNRVRHTQMVHVPQPLCIPAWDMCLLAWTEAECQNMEFGEQIQGEVCCWLCRNSLRGWDEELHNWKCSWRKPRKHRIKVPLLSKHKRWERHYNISPHALVPASSD